jgi:hypothetical protein
VRCEPNLKIRSAVQMHLLLKKEKSVYIFHISVVTGIILGDLTSQVCVLDTEKYSASGRSTSFSRSYRERHFGLVKEFSA